MSGLTDHRLERTIFFSDAVIAIAITLLIIEVHIPVLPSDKWSIGMEALQHLLPSFFGVILSFLVIGRFWLGHSTALGSMHSYDPRLFRVNLYFLLMIVIMPFATGFLSANLGMTVPAAFYNLVLMLTALANIAVIMVATDPKSGHSAHDPDEARVLRRRALLVLAATALCLMLAFVVPPLSQAPILIALLADRVRNLIPRAAS